jgi:hypothetical protein
MHMISNQRGRKDYLPVLGRIDYSPPQCEIFDVFLFGWPLPLPAVSTSFFSSTPLKGERGFEMGYCEM